MSNKRKVNPVLKLTSAEFAALVKNSKSISEVLSSLDLTNGGSNYRFFKKRAVEEEVPTAHFLSSSEQLKALNKKRGRSLEDILKKGVVINSHNLKKRLYKEGFLEEKCSRCGQGTIWNGKPLSLHLDHIDGDSTNNELTNLRILCPNCHSLTDTYTGRV